jgi:Poly(hydroxyalcanoate) granule associated protein (phasin)
MPTVKKTPRVASKKIVAKKPLNVAAKPKAKQVKSQSGAAVSSARKVYLASLGAATKLQTRVQNEATKMVGRFTTEAQRITEMTSEAASSLAKKANLYVREGKKIQNETLSAAEAKARDAAKEVAAFAKKQENSFKGNVERTLAATMASAKEGVAQLEHVFETRVAKTLNTFGIPSSADVRELQVRMADLQKALNQLNKRSVRV